MSSEPPLAGHTGLRIAAVSVRMGANSVLSGIDLDVPHRSIVALLGPSGCGKTTLLRTVAGLQPHLGHIYWDSKLVDQLPAHRRGFGLVFQDQALFPHLNVSNNVGYGLRELRRAARRRGVSTRASYASERGAKRADQARVAELLRLVSLGDMATRPIDLLSGGEQQRVCLARALAPQPHLLMLDEPLSGLDRPLREQLLADLGRILADVEQTALYVTHDLEEALAIADQVAVLNAGRIEQIADPATIYALPETEFVARFLGLDNVLPAATNGKTGELQTPLGVIRVAAGVQWTKALLHSARIEIRGGGAVPSGVGAEGVHTARADDQVQIPARVESTSFRGARQLVKLAAVVGEPIRLSAYSAARAPLLVGSLVSVVFRPQDALVPLRE